MNQEIKNRKLGVTPIQTNAYDEYVKKMQLLDEYNQLYKNIKTSPSEESLDLSYRRRQNISSNVDLAQVTPEKARVEPPPKPKRKAVPTI